MERYDIAIIGTGPAGISAAITAKLRNKKILLAGSGGLSKKLICAQEINNYPGFPAVKGEKLAEAFSVHLKGLDIKITETKVANIYAMGDYFALQSSMGDFEALSVIVATGVMQDKLLEGEEANVGRGVSYCATCDAALYKGKNVIVAGYDKKVKKRLISSARWLPRSFTCLCMLRIMRI
jgi:Thioredoxin reductase